MITMITLKDKLSHLLQGLLDIGHKPANNLMKTVVDLEI